MHPSVLQRERREKLKQKAHNKEGTVKHTAAAGREVSERDACTRQEAEAEQCEEEATVVSPAPACFLLECTCQHCFCSGPGLLTACPLVAFQLHPPLLSWVLLPFIHRGTAPHMSSSYCCAASGEPWLPPKGITSAHIAGWHLPGHSAVHGCFSSPHTP